MHFPVEQSKGLLTLRGSCQSVRSPAIEEHVGTLLSLVHLLDRLGNHRVDVDVVELKPPLAGRGRSLGLGAAWNGDTHKREGASLNTIELEWITHTHRMLYIVHGSIK